ncbi:CoA ester lyase [Roseicyclus sp. F158]|uniref:CoA ester lyase n=1 Tax=Tropicimonas omnivorans TaxID=3075590 RepID=A0ABU3DDE7_9RHOB|nr:CoA ester lyase [Roseicyclus sp. F158]MDT0681739.1 CoA ester lyase [Roseicyclus sp. F158]
MRSLLYVPASNARALAKARDLPADALILDLEDAVAPAEKAAARGMAAAALAEGGFGRRMTILRVNALDTEWGRDDLAAATDADAVLLPKISGAEAVEGYARALGDGPEIWAMAETPSGVLRAAEIAAEPRVRGLVIGTNDLAAELGCRPGPGRAELQMALQSCVLAARAAGVACIDGVYNAIKDEDGFRAECAQGLALGMDGKSLIHPSQIAAANEIFVPSAAEIDLARRQIDAFAEAERNGRGVAVLDGRIVEALHARAAQRLLERVAEIQS